MMNNSLRQGARTAFFAVAFLSLLPASLLAGETSSPSDPKASVAAQGANAPKSIWERDTLTGDWGGSRPKLADKGVTITPSLVGENFGNIGGGIRQGDIANGLVTVALDVDTAKLTGWENGGTFHTNFLYAFGPGLRGDTRNVGDIAVLSNISAYNTPRMQECWYDQPFWDKKADFKIGWIAADTEFWTSSSAALFINSDFGTLPIISANNPYNPPIYPIAAPGVRFRVQPVATVYFQTGLFSGNPGSPVQNRNGLDFRISGKTGVFNINEVGYLLNQAPDDKGLPGTYKLGAFVHTGIFQTWASQADGGILNEQGPDFGLYAVADQQVWKQDVRIVSVFARGGYAPSDINQVNPYVDTGFNLTGFVPCRENDVAGVAFARSFISGSYSAFNQTVNGAPNTMTAETVIEATYKFQLTPWWSLQPDFQFIFSPSGVDGSRDATVLGVRTSVVF